MPRPASDDRDVEHTARQVALALQESAVHDGDDPERRVQVSNLGLELSSLMKIPSVHVLLKDIEGYCGVREFALCGSEFEAIMPCNAQDLCEIKLKQTFH